MARIDGRWHESKTRVERYGCIVFRMNRKRAHAGQFRDLQRTLHGMAQEFCSDAATMPFTRHRKTRQNNKRNGMPRETFRYALRSLRVYDMAGHERVIADNGVVAQRDIGARCICLLRLKGVDDQK